MALNNCNDSSTSQTPDHIVCASLTEIRNEKNTAVSNKAAAGTSRESNEVIIGYKICCIDRAEESHSLYQDLMSCVVLGQNKKAEIIQKNIEEYSKKDDEIEKLIADSSKLINELCTKVGEANSELCSMTTCVKDLISADSKKKNNGKDDTDEDVAKILECLNEINTTTTEMKNKAENAAESVITIAGAQTFTNTEGLKSFIDAVVGKVAELKECTDSNITSTEEEVKKAREELNEVVQELAQAECDEAAANTTINGLENVEKFICKCDCKGESLDVCDELAKCRKEKSKTDKKELNKSVDKN